MSSVKKMSIAGSELYVVEETVKILRRFHSDLPGDDPEDHNKKIGSSMGETGKGNTGLTMEEEILWLPKIVKTKPTSEHWETAVDTYAHNISVKVTSKGKTLNIGMKFTKETDATKYAKRMDKLSVGVNDGSYQAKSIELLRLTFNGTPLNVSDYILWRYCLIYSKVANEPEFVNKSQNIWFYLKDESREKAKAMGATEMRSSAYARFLKIKDSGDEVVMAQVLRLFDKKPDFFDKGEKTVLLERLAIEESSKFVQFTNTKYDLTTIAFIKQGLEIGILETIDNTEIIKQSGGEQQVLGNNMEAAAKMLNTKDGEKLYKLLKTQLQVETKS